MAGPHFSGILSLKFFEHLVLRKNLRNYVDIVRKIFYNQIPLKKTI